MIYRVDVRPVVPTDHGLSQQMSDADVKTGAITASRIFLIDADATRDQVIAAAGKLLADPIAERAEVYAETPPSPAASLIEVHLKPGVMDPVAASAEAALRDLGIDVKQVRTGRAFAFENKLDRPALEGIARRYLANAVVETVYFEPHLPRQFPQAAVAPFEIRRVPIRDLSDEQLTKLSRDGHLFLNLTEMQAIRRHYKSLGREPTDVELETLAQTWSEHCVHKTLKSAVEVVDESGNVLRAYKNLIKETIFQSTMDLIRGTGYQPVKSDHGLVAHATKADFCLSVFKDNAGVIAFDDEDAVCFKVETHNRPSAIEPYGGAATGIGGCIRDVLGTGLGARPIANTNVFCVAYPDRSMSRRVGESVNREAKEARLTDSPTHRLIELPPGVIHPKRILQQVVAGVRDYGNRMGIPTVNGAVHFDECYVGNPLVFAGCVGIIPRDKIEKKVNAGDAIVVMGGRTGRDGIHGATFSSAELTSTHADEFSHAVQIGNAITQKKLMDVLLVARDRGLYSAVTDCGAGGLSSAVGEMGGELGAEVDLDKVPLKYAGLRYDEIWISEAQERMVLAVPPRHVAELLKLSADENVETTVIGTFGTQGQELILRYDGTEVGRMSMAFMHDGIPMPTRRAVVKGSGVRGQGSDNPSSSLTPDPCPLTPQLLAKLAEPNVASKHWIIRQYDHEVQGGTVIKPLVGPRQIGPSDAAVIRPKSTSTKGVVIANGLVTSIEDPYAAALASIDEAIRNAVCVGADLNRLAILDNFCWPGVHDEVSMGTLVRACEACRDGALGYGIPFISGKDSLHNQFTDAATGRVIRIPNTLLISAIGVIDDVTKCVTSDFKRPDDGVFGGNAIVMVTPVQTDRNVIDAANIAAQRRIHEQVSAWIASGIVKAAHDISEGGALVAIAEMCIGSGFGVRLEPQHEVDWFAECNAGYILEVDAGDAYKTVFAMTGADGSLPMDVTSLGNVQREPRLVIEGLVDVSVDDLTRAWRGTLAGSSRDIAQAGRIM